MTDSSDVPEAFNALQEQMGRVSLHAIDHQPENLVEIMLRIESAETMLRGLPQIVEAMEEIETICHEHVDSLREILKAAEDESDAYAVVNKTEAALARGISNTVRQQAVIARSVRALAKTQIGLARSVQHFGSMLLIVVSSQDFLSDASQLANRCGRGEEGLRAFARQKFGDALNPQGETDDGQ